MKLNSLSSVKRPAIVNVETNFQKKNTPSMLYVPDILDELLHEGVRLDREQMLDFVNRFNLKVVDLAISGFVVNTGLLCLHSISKGGYYCYQLNQCEIEYLGVVTGGVSCNRIDKIQNEISKDESFRSLECAANNTTCQETTENVPACGINFRTWLCKA